MRSKAIATLTLTLTITRSLNHNESSRRRKPNEQKRNCNAMDNNIHCVCIGAEFSFMTHAQIRQILNHISKVFSLKKMEMINEKYIRRNISAFTFKSKSCTKCAPNDVPPVFCICKKTITSCASRSNWKSSFRTSS